MRTDLRDENFPYVRRRGNGCWFSSVYLTLVVALKNKTQYVCKVQSSSIKFALPVSLKCFLGRCGHSPRVYWYVSGRALGETATEDSSCFILNSSLDQPRKRFSRGWAVLNGYSPSSILPTGIWKGRPVPITLNQAFAMTSLRLTEEDRKGGDMTLPSAPLAVAGTAEEICESELIQAVESNPVTPAAK